MPSFSIALSFNHDLNTSLQVGDNVYYNSLTSSSGFSHSAMTSTIHVGVVTSISQDPAIIVVLSSYTDNTGSPCVAGVGGCVVTVTPPVGAFISFSKSSVVNNNDLTGYYASVEFVNNSLNKAELFSVAANVIESSK
tara:strand:- start:1874 stop:2284 length:411 start_codon:yes stop_codon:yes gene_type:complete